MNKLSMGIDVGDKKCFISCYSFDGDVVMEGKPIQTNDESTWRELLEELSSQYAITAAFEIGPHYDWLYDLLMEYCQEVEVINSQDFVLIHRSHKKTDKIDSIKIAEAILRGGLPSVYVPAKATRQDRRLVSFIHSHSQKQAKVKNQIRSLLKPLRIEAPCQDILAQTSRKWLAEEVLPGLDEYHQMTLRMLLEQADMLIEQRAQLDQRVSERLADYQSVEILDSIPGVGPLTALALASAIDDVSRFEEPGQLASYFGVCGSVYRSGNMSKRGRMTKRGNIHVRWLLGQALRSLHRKDPKARRRYDRLKRGKHTKVARGAQMRWLVEIVWHLLKKNETYKITVKPKTAA